MASDAFVLIISMLGVGYAFARLRVLPDTAADTLNRVVLYLCLPAAVLLALPKLHLDLTLIGLALTPWVVVLMTWGLLRLSGCWIHLRRDEYAVLLLCVGLGNTGFVGYPMVAALLGQDALAYAVIYDQFGTFLLMSTFGLYVCASYGGEARPTARDIVLRILRFPPAWALVVALTIMPEAPPGWLAHGLKSLADAMLPLVMLAVGFSLRFQLPRSDIRSLTLGLGLKLLLLPVLVWLGSALVGMEGQVLQANVLETAMPPMITAAVLAIAHNLAPRLAAALVGYGILLAMFSLPLWAWVLSHLL
jgi:predicted permease